MATIYYDSDADPSIIKSKKEQITIKDLLSILQITKQSLSRVLNQLVKEKYILISTGEDK